MGYGWPEKLKTWKEWGRSVTYSKKCARKRERLRAKKNPECQPMYKRSSKAIYW